MNAGHVSLFLTIRLGTRFFLISFLSANNRSPNADGGLKVRRRTAVVRLQPIFVSIVPTATIGHLNEMLNIHKKTLCIIYIQKLYNK